MSKTIIYLFTLATVLSGVYSGCNDPGDVDNSLRDLVGLEEGDTVNYTCKAGYKIQGQSTLTVTVIRTCETGAWTGSQPACVDIQCSDPGDVTHSNKSVTDFGYQGTVTYTCDPGYRTATGSRGVTLTCQYDEQWSKTPPTCSRVQCPAPEDIPDASHDGGSIFLYNDEVTYTCDDGYEMSQGNSTLKCDENGRWSGTWPLCTRISCGDPGELRYATRLLTGVLFQDTVHYTCMDGFHQSPDSSPMNRTCEAAGTWSDSAPVCLGSLCGKPDEPTNATKIPTDPTYRYPESVEYECLPGFNPDYVDGSVSKVTCTKDGTWDLKPMKCAPIVCKEDKQAVNAIIPTDVTYYGQTRIYQCKPGYKVDSGLLERDCLTNGSLSGSAPVCKEFECDVLTDQPNADKTGSGNKFQDSVTYKCHSGFQVEGEVNSFQRQLYCQADGKWSDDVPNCIPLDCGNAEVGTHVTILSQNGSGYNDVIDMTCDEGYELQSGDLSRKCLANQSWSGVAPVCVAISCGEPPAKDHVTRLGSMFTFASSVFYTCASGYVAVGNGETSLTCLLNKTWAGSNGSALPECERIKCYQPQQIVGATLLSDYNLPYNYTDNITYVCDSGYQWDNSSGPLQRICLANKQWSGPAPICQRKSCGDPGDVEGSTKQGVGYRYLDTVNYTCKPGYEVESGRSWSVITCQANQTWTGFFPTCKRIQCPDPGIGEHSSRVVGGFLFQDIIEYSCDEYYRVDSGIYRLQCTESRNWTFPVPECVPVEGINATEKVDSNMGPAVESENSDLIGKICIICMAVEFGVMVLLDVTTMWKDLRLGIKNIKHGIKMIKRNRMVTEDRVSPLIEDD